MCGVYLRTFCRSDKATLITCGDYLRTCFNGLRARLFLRPVSLQSRHGGGVGGDRLRSRRALVGMDADSALLPQNHSPLVAKEREGRGRPRLSSFPRWASPKTYLWITRFLWQCGLPLTVKGIHDDTETSAPQAFAFLIGPAPYNLIQGHLPHLFACNSFWTINTRRRA
jgi:hypothetical protein